MDLDTIKETLTFLGSSGAILFIPKLYLDYKKQKRLQEDQLQDNKVLQENQHRLDKELSELKSKQDSMIFMTNRQYEKEFDIYLEIFQSIGNCQKYLLKGIDSFEMFEENIEQSNVLMKNAGNKLESEIHELNYLNKRYSPFIKKSVSNLLSELIIVFRSLLKEIEEKHRLLGLEQILNFEAPNQIDELIQKQNECIEMLESNIRDYLNQIRTI
ncbi:hypothetical protein [Vagococcus luciliae]|uniref:Uncharacterized protein n=1 Tax=Vagococcus luciliae TaxID=2920380 RepID=A0ABY5NXM4_9ENTE|nr:hypothetical protein [Vagococcus luciliae]UUV98405.1 hypothetical protein G314FT_05210 [Vagococcus luciliae]